MSLFRSGRSPAAAGSSFEFLNPVSAEVLEDRRLLSAAAPDALLAVQIEGDAAAASSVTLMFDTPLDRAWAEDISHYVIDGKSVRQRKGEPAQMLPSCRSPQLISAGYDDAAHSVTLSTSEPMQLTRQLRSLWIAGDETRSPILHTLRLRAGRKLAFNDGDGDAAKISLSVNGRASVLQDLTTGAAQQLWLNGSDSGASVLSSAVKTGRGGGDGAVWFGKTVISGAVSEEGDANSSLNFGIVTGSFTIAPSPVDPPAVVDPPTPIDPPAPIDPPPADNGSAPHVRLVSPDRGFETTSPGYIFLRATADDGDGIIERVEFYNGKELLGTTTAAPYSFAWRDVAPGDYKITAKAYDATGNSTSTAVVDVKVHAPPAGRSIIVSPDGNDANSGLAEDHAVQTIGRAAALARRGDTVVIRPGIYRETITLDHSGTAAKPITFSAEPGTVFIDGAHFRADLFVATNTSAARYITLRGITFRNASNEAQNHNAAVRTGDGWRVEDCTFVTNEGNGLGVFGSDVVLLRDIAKDNGCSGIGGTGATNLLMLDCESAGNNTEGHSGGLEGGGGKFTRTDGVLVENYNSHDNWGPAIWFDYNNINVAVRNSNLHDNKSLHYENGKEKIGGTGIFFELGGIRENGTGTGIAGETGAMLAEGNHISNNQAMGITVYSSQNVTLQDNDLSADPIELLGNRQAPFVISDLVIRDNSLAQSPILADTDTTNRAKTAGVSIDHNTYKGKEDARGLFRWGGEILDSLKDVREKLGFEHHGKKE